MSKLKSFKAFFSRSKDLPVAQTTSQNDSVVPLQPATPDEAKELTSKHLRNSQGHNYDVSGACSQSVNDSDREDDDYDESALMSFFNKADSSINNALLLAKGCSLQPDNRALAEIRVINDKPLVATSTFSKLSQTSTKSSASLENAEITDFPKIEQGLQLGGAVLRREITSSKLPDVESVSIHNGSPNSPSYILAYARHPEIEPIASTASVVPDMRGASSPWSSSQLQSSRFASPRKQSLTGSQRPSSPLSPGTPNIVSRRSSWFDGSQLSPMSSTSSMMLPPAPESRLRVSSEMGGAQSLHDRLSTVAMCGTDSLPVSPMHSQSGSGGSHHSSRPRSASTVSYGSRNSGNRLRPKDPKGTLYSSISIPSRPTSAILSAINDHQLPSRLSAPAPNLSRPPRPPPPQQASTQQT